MKGVSWARAAMEKNGGENRAIQTAKILFHFLQDVHGNYILKKRKKRFKKVRREVQKHFRALTSNVPVITGQRGVWVCGRGPIGHYRG